MVVGKSLTQLGNRTCKIRIHASHDGLIVKVQGGPAQSDGVFVHVQKLRIGRLNIRYHRAMPGASHLDADITLPLHFDHFIANSKSLLTLRCSVIVFAFQSLQIQVLNIRTRVGKAPCGLVGSTQNNKWQARQSSTHHIQRRMRLAVRELAGGRMQARKIPNSRGT